MELLQIIGIGVIWLILEIYLIWLLIRKKKCCPCPPVYGYCGMDTSDREGTPDCPNFYKKS